MIGLKGLRICNAIDPQQSLLVRPVLGRDCLHRAPSFHHVSIMNHPLAVHLVAAARQRDPQLLPDFNQTRVGNFIHRCNFLVLHEPREHDRGDVVEVVAGLHDVLRALVGDAGAVGAEARERDEDLLEGGYVLGRGGGEGEVIGSEKGAEVGDVEEGFDGVEGCGVFGDVVDEGLAGGGGGGGAVEGGGGGGCGEK